MATRLPDYWSQQRTTRFWWIRHAPVPHLADRIYGSTDPDCDVSKAEPFAALARRLPSDAAWYVTHLRRTHQTASAIGKAGYALPELRVEPDLGEQNFGELHGVPHVENGARRSDAFRGFWVNSPYEPAPGGESFLDLHARVSAAVDRITHAHPEQDVVIVAHGGPIMAALAHALDLDPTRAVSLSIDNLSLTRIHRLHEPHDGGPEWRVLGVGERAS